MADRYQDGLDGLAEFDYAWLVTWLHKLAGPGHDPPLRQVPFLLRSQQRTKGMFATRSGWFDHVTISDGITPAQLPTPKSPS